MAIFFTRYLLLSIDTGMGEDGAQGMLALKKEGALTITQKAETCVINGMPAAARALAAALYDLSPEEMAILLNEIAGAKNDKI
jgi:two-component system chemotaxis response regulator CheB